MRHCASLLDSASRAVSNRDKRRAAPPATQSIDWALVGIRLGLLPGLVLLCATFAARTFGTTQRSM